MNILNKEELRKQIREGKEISLDGILEEFKSLLRESLQTASEEELTSHLGYEKHQESENTNYRNGHSKKSLKTKYGQIDVQYQEIEKEHLNKISSKKRENFKR
ncbi:transposase [Arcobacter cryaerophilus gv. pseudocryaerophilus]